ncbi:MAG: hypothetical protein JRI22_12625 [Deltaproteobacteria bacterium]|nr:hypothetical protein [Deltaproteobacteria bacterium]
MKVRPKKILMILFLFMILAGITLYLEANRYKIIETYKGDRRIKVKIDRWTGKHYRTLYRVDAAEAVHDFSTKSAPPRVAAPDKTIESAGGMKPAAAVLPPPSPTVPPSKAEAPAPADKAFTKKAAVPASAPEQQTPHSLPTHKKDEKATVKPPSPKRAAISDCGFPVTSSSLINLALTRWCRARQDANYKQMSREERNELRSRIWEETCRKSAFASYWKALSFEQRKEFSRIYFKIASL